jgi:hypothetical protein
MKKTTTKPSFRETSPGKKPYASSEMKTVLQVAGILGGQSRNNLPAAEEPLHSRLQGGLRLALSAL